MARTATRMATARRARAASSPSWPTDSPTAASPALTISAIRRSTTQPPTAQPAGHRQQRTQPAAVDVAGRTVPRHRAHHGSPVPQRLRAALIAGPGASPARTLRPLAARSRVKAPVELPRFSCSFERMVQLPCALLEAVAEDAHRQYRRLLQFDRADVDEGAEHARLAEGVERWHAAGRRAQAGIDQR